MQLQPVHKHASNEHEEYSLSLILKYFRSIQRKRQKQSHKIFWSLEEKINPLRKLHC